MSRRLLLIEDERDTRELLALLFEASGFEVTTSPTPQQAAATLSVRGYDLVVTDLLSDDATVDESWRALDELLELAGPTPVGLVSGWPRMVQQHDERRVAFRLLKPVRSERLLAAVSGAIDLPPVTAHHEALIRGYFAAIQAGDYGGLVARCTEDVAYNLPGDGPLANRIVGRDAFRAFAQATFETFVDPRFAIESIRPLPEGALVGYEGSWTDATGGRQTMPGSVLFVFRGSQICEVGVRVDLAHAPS